MKEGKMFPTYEVSPTVPTIVRQVPPRSIPGWKLDRRYPPQTAAEKALLAVDLASGVPLERVSRTLAISLAGTNVVYYAIARSLTPAERARVENGQVTLPGVARERRQAAAAIAEIA
jgi:hypothetical protein